MSHCFLVYYRAQQYNPHIVIIRVTLVNVSLAQVIILNTY